MSKEIRTISSCEYLKCNYYVKGICTDETDTVSMYTGEDCCSRREDAILREEYQENE